MSKYSRITGFYIGYKKPDTHSYIFTTYKTEYAQEYSSEITGLDRLTTYTIVLQGFNSKGPGPLSEPVTVSTAEYDPPEAPLVAITTVTSHTVGLKWDLLSDDSPIYGYILAYKKTVELHYIEKQLSSHLVSYTLTDLDCGTGYSIYIQGYNSMGKGRPSDLLAVKTTGSVPLAPDKETLIYPNSTYLVVYLNVWRDYDCLIDHFIIQWKPSGNDTWIMIPEADYTLDNVVYIRNLIPATWYDVWIAARNGAGTTEAQYKIATLTENGGK